MGNLSEQVKMSNPIFFALNSGSGGKYFHHQDLSERFEGRSAKLEDWNLTEQGTARDRDMNALWFVYVLSKVSVRFLYVDLQNRYPK